MNDIRIDITKLQWFSNDVPTGKTGCYCSGCKQLIPKDEVVIRLICGPCMKQLRFHTKCYESWFIDPIMGVPFHSV